MKLQFLNTVDRRFASGRRLSRNNKCSRSFVFTDSSFFSISFSGCSCGIFLKRICCHPLPPSLQKCAKRFLLFFLLFCHTTSPLQKCAKLMALSEVEPPQVPLRSACGSTRLQHHAPSPSASLASLAPSLLEHHTRPVRGVVSRAYFET